MAGKRTATTELNHDNWNEEQEPEEAGTFARATNAELRKRVLKTAKRGRVLPMEFQEGSLKSAFESFTGFNTPPAKNAPFSFLASVSTSPSTTVNTTPTVTTVNSNKNVASNGATKLTENDAKTEETSKPQTTSNTATGKQVSTEQGSKKVKKNSSDYHTRLKGLNESVAQWIKSHVDSNPFCILTPIFKDYERYLKEIVSKEESTKAQTTSHTTEQTSKVAPNDNKKDESMEKKPIFKNYENYLKEIMSKEESTKAQTTSYTTEHTSKVAQNDNKKDENIEKKPDNLFGGNTNITTKSSSLGGTEWKPEKSVFSNIISSTKSIFSASEQKTESPKTLFSSTDVTSEVRKPIFGNLETNTSSKSIFGNVSAENNPFLQKLPIVPDSKVEEEQTKSDTKLVAPTFPSSTFSFGQSSASSNVTAGFSFGSGKAFSFATCPIKPQDQEEKTDNDNKDENDEEPPKPDFKPVTEEGAIYEQRCKVFVKKDGNFSDRGVGMLFLKPTPNGKTQLIVRAETALGNLLLNILLTQSIPIKRMNKNTIMLVCLPMPDSPPPPVPVLLRVKTSDTADTLFETLDKHTK